mmetsp:Transcript_21892/g.74238  ORF Transcript_21892/g.74238 Transcript_21892/m.74238 type:complete len:236 (+) Transcript_21892:1522-2229(+)
MSKTPKPPTRTRPRRGPLRKWGKRRRQRQSLNRQCPAVPRSRCDGSLPRNFQSRSARPSSASTANASSTLGSCDGAPQFSSRSTSLRRPPFRSAAARCTTASFPYTTSLPATHPSFGLCICTLPTCGGATWSPSSSAAILASRAGFAKSGDSSAKATDARSTSRRIGAGASGARLWPRRNPRTTRSSTLPNQPNQTPLRSTASRRRSDSAQETTTMPESSSADAPGAKPAPGRLH